MEHDSKLNAWYSTIRITPNTPPMSLTPTTALTNENTMNYIAQDLLMTTEMDSDNSTDHSAIYSDGSALVLRSDICEFEMFDGDEDNEFDADYDIYLGETILAAKLV